MIDHGAKLSEILKQSQYHPFPIEEQVVSIFTGVKGYLDKIPIEQIKEFESTLLKQLKTDDNNILASIKEQGQITEEIEKKLKTFLENFIKKFLSTEGK